MSREKALIAFLAIIVAVWFAARQVGKHEADVWWQSHCPAVSQKVPQTVFDDALVKERPCTQSEKKRIENEDVHGPIRDCTADVSWSFNPANPEVVHQFVPNTTTSVPTWTTTGTASASTSGWTGVWVPDSLPDQIKYCEHTGGLWEGMLGCAHQWNPNGTTSTQQNGQEH